MYGDGCMVEREWRGVNAGKFRRIGVQTGGCGDAVADAKLHSLNVRIRTQVSEYERLTLTFSRLTV